MKEKYIVIILSHHSIVGNYVVILSIERSLLIKKYHNILSKIRYSFKIKENSGVCRTCVEEGTPWPTHTCHLEAGVVLHTEVLLCHSAYLLLQTVSCCSEST